MPRCAQGFVSKHIILIAMMDELILHYELHCKNCGAPMLLPAGMIERLFADPDAQPNHSHAIAVVCHLCKSVATYFPERTSPNHSHRGLVIFADPIRETMDGPILASGPKFSRLRAFPTIGLCYSNCRNPSINKREYEVAWRDLAHRLIKGVSCTVGISLWGPEVSARNFIAIRLILIDPPIAHGWTPNNLE